MIVKYPVWENGVESMNIEEQKFKCMWLANAYMYMLHIYIFCASITLSGGKGYPRAPSARRGEHSLTGWLHIYL